MRFIAAFCGVLVLLLALGARNNPKGVPVNCMPPSGISTRLQALGEAPLQYILHGTHCASF